MVRTKTSRDNVPRSLEDDYDWPWKLSIYLPPNEQPKVCFLSGKEREYFPSDTGHSRHGVEYSMNCHPGDTPNPTYRPSDIRLSKPVSRKGFGIGGLSGRRFSTTSISSTPGPADYQSPISQPITKADDNGNTDKLIRDCPQTIAFGSRRDLDRFARDSKWDSVGVGSYDLIGTNASRKLVIDTGFGAGPVRVIPPTETYCQYERFDNCVECEVELSTTDYYRSRRPIRFPHVEIERSASEAELVDVRPKRGHVSLCRQCYCGIMKKGHRFLTKRSLLLDFQKTRHCVNVHEHEHLPVFQHKAPCHLIRKLTRKEGMMAKYFNDSCDNVTYRLHT